MRTKSLVLAAALSAAGIASTYAQSVYSVNAVGYINVTCGAGYTMIANQLVTTNNTVAQLFANAPDGSALMVWNQSIGTFDQNNYLFGSWDNAEARLAPGQAAFFVNGGSDPVTFTFVGEVPQGTNLTVNLINGYNMVSSIVPQAGLVTTDLGFTPEEGDTVMKWNQTIGTYDQYNFLFGSWDEEPTIAVGQGVFITTGAPKSWVRSFQIN